MIVEGGAPPVGISKTRDVHEDSQPRLGPGTERPAVDQRLPRAGERTLAGCLVAGSLVLLASLLAGQFSGLAATVVSVQQVGGQIPGPGELYLEELPKNPVGSLGLAETIRTMNREDDLTGYRTALRIDPGSRRAGWMVAKRGSRSRNTPPEGSRPAPLNAHLGGWAGTVHDGSLGTGLRLCLRAGDPRGPRSSVDLPDLGYYDLEARIEEEGGTLAVAFALREDTVRISLDMEGETARGRWHGPGIWREARLWRTRECGPRYRAQQIEFRNGDHLLAGTLLLPSHSSGPYPAVVWTHGSGAIDRSNPTYRGLAVALTELGVASLIYDKRGVGGSSGDYRSATMWELAADAVAGVQWLALHPDVNAEWIGVGGISQGGWVSPAAAVLSPAVGFVVGLSAPGVSPAEQNLFNQHNRLVNEGVDEDVVRRVDDVLREIYQYHRTGEGRAAVERTLRSLTEEPWFETAHELAYWHRRGLEPLSASYMEDLFFNPEEVWTRVTVPSILVWGADDSLVPAEVSRDVIGAALDATGDARRTFLIFPRTDHSLRLPSPQPWTWGTLHPGYRAVADFILAIAR